MTDSQKTKCHAIIHGAAASAGAIGAGLAQAIVVHDYLAIAPIQIGMVIALGQVFGISVDKGTAEGLLKAGMATYMGQFAVKLLVGWIPGVGNAINAGVAAAITEGIGWQIAKKFEADANLGF